MALIPGTRLGAYEVVAQLGVGGMGEVYRATDTTLKRQVALKVLPASVASDADRLARFQREAEVLAALNHPNIAAIYGIERSGDMTALVMELVQGDDLSQRIAKGAIPVDEALPIAKQIAEALEAAHEQGIIHRDLKPANIKVRSDGTVKVLDFGLAKAMEPTVASSPSMSMSPTITTPAMTQAGMILGTAAYMSPEQARGKTVDRRADIWSFGCVLYEMLTGQRAFGGEDVAETIANVINKEPAWEALSPAVPTHVCQTLRMCLKKSIRERVPDIGAVRLALEGAFETTGPHTMTGAAAPRERVAWMTALTLAVLAVIALAIPTLRHSRETLPSLHETRLDIGTPTTDQPADFALSPDGREIVFVAAGDGVPRLWLRSLAAATAQPMPGTEGARDPFWSPDGNSVGYFTANSLKRLDLLSGATRTLAPAIASRGGTWNASGVIVFAEGGSATLRRVSATGGAATEATTLGPNQQFHRWPQMLPDGSRFLFYAQGAPDASGIYLGTLDGAPPTRLTSSDSAGVYLPSLSGSVDASTGGGWLLWVQAGSLLAERLDLQRPALTGAPQTIAEGVSIDLGGNRGAVSAVAGGLIAYRTSGAARQLAWFDRTGKPLGTLGAPDDGLEDPGLSPDAHRVVVSRTVAGNKDIWLMDDSGARRLTFDPAIERFPIWSPDGHWIAFDSNRNGHRDLYRKAINGAAAEELLLASDQDKTALSWSPDGGFLLYGTSSQTTQRDLWVKPLQGNQPPFAYLKTQFDERTGTLSPDGKWVAYQSNESGPLEVYVRAFPASSAQWQISTAGGIQPRWRADGTELYFIAPDGALMAAPVTVREGALQTGTPVALFRTRIWRGGMNGNIRQQYDVAPDGRFLINTVVDSATAPITLIQNWQPEAKK